MMTMKELANNLQAASNAMLDAAMALPEPGTEVADLLDALAVAEEEVNAHFAQHRWDGMEEHDHGSCVKRGKAICSRCEDWDRVYHMRISAIDALTRYALALRAQRKAA